MSKVAVVFWSGSGNTEAMAQAVAAGAKEAGAQVDTFEIENFGADKVAEYDGVALGCPAMGDEELEDSTFEPALSQIEPGLSGKKVALFGSYGWGEGDWMRSWEQRCAEKQIALAVESVIANEAPDEEAQTKCKALGAALS